MFQVSRQASPEALPSASSLCRTRLHQSQFRFRYQFQSGYCLSGVLMGDRLLKVPNLVFNLSGLEAVCCDPAGQVILRFDTVFGQFQTHYPEMLFSGSNAETGDFFSFNYRDRDAVVYDARSDRWLSVGWNPDGWNLEEITTSPTYRLSAPASKVRLTSSCNSGKVLEMTRSPRRKRCI